MSINLKKLTTVTIYFDGARGSGKTTLAAKITKFLMLVGYDVKVSHTKDEKEILEVSPSEHK